MKKRLLLVGGGVIARHYAAGLAASDTLELVALVDRDPNCPARELLGVPFFADLSAAVAATRPELALLATPAPSRMELAALLMERGVGVLTEKPMGVDLAEIEAFYALSLRHGTPIDCLFHWAAADEVLWLKENLKRFGAVKRFSAHILDDYAARGEVRPDRRGLMGAWYDSGINVLSYLDEIADLTDVRLLGGEERLDGNGQAVYTRKSFRIGDMGAEITVDWTTESRRKTSRIECEHGVLEIDHTAQRITCGGDVLYSSPTEDRLASHYLNLFHDYAPSSASRERVVRLHRILFTGGTK